jgi:hypothetical protein
MLVQSRCLDEIPRAAIRFDPTKRNGASRKVRGSCGSATAISKYPKGSGQSRYWFKKFCGSDRQTMGELYDIDQADVSLAAFDPTYVVSMQFR